MSCPFKLRKLVFLGVLICTMTACVPKMRLTLAVNVKSELNGNSPIAFDIVQVNDKDLAKQLAQMTAADWFQKRDQIRRDFPKKSSLVLREWEWVPGQVVHDLTLPMVPAPRLLLAFANYHSPGPHRARLDPKVPVLITLGKDDFELAPLEKSAAKQ